MIELLWQDGTSTLLEINPKEAVYGTTPLVYAGAAVILAIAFNRTAAWAARQPAS